MKLRAQVLREALEPAALRDIRLGPAARRGNLQDRCSCKRPMLLHNGKTQSHGGDTIPKDFKSPRPLLLSKETVHQFLRNAWQHAVTPMGKVSFIGPDGFPQSEDPQVDNLRAGRLHQGGPYLGILRGNLLAALRVTLQEQELTLLSV